MTFLVGSIDKDCTSSSFSQKSITEHKKKHPNLIDINIYLIDNKGGDYFMLQVPVV